MTFDELLRGTQRFGRDYRGKRLRVEVTQVIPYLGMNYVLFVMNVRSETKMSSAWVVSLAFYNLKMFRAKDKPPRMTKMTNYFVVDYKRERHYVEMPSLRRTKIRIRCSCPDFYFTFSHTVRQAKALYGGPFKRYVRKTKTRPPRNPSNFPGFCKHINEGIEYLRRTDVVRR